MWRIRHIIALGPILTLSACIRMSVTQDAQPVPEPQPTPMPTQTETPSAAPECGGKLTREQRVYLDLVQKMVAQKQFYAALAHLDQLEKGATSAPQSTYLRAEALRGTGRHDDAEKLYRGLLNGCMVGHGWHGLGLIAAAKGQTRQGEEFLLRASRERPVDGAVHNDLGMAMLLDGKREQAEREFRTALELDRNNPLPAENLIVLMLMENRREEAKLLGQQRGLGEADMTRLAERARFLARRPGGGR